MRITNYAEVEAGLSWHRVLPVTHTTISIYVVGSKLQAYATRPKGGMGRLKLIFVSARWIWKLKIHYWYCLAISDSVFSGCSSTASIIKNSTYGCIATLFAGLPIIPALMSPEFKTFETWRSVVFDDIHKAAATSSTWNPNISFIQMARHERSSLYGRGIVNFADNYSLRSHIPLRSCHVGLRHWSDICTLNTKGQGSVDGGNKRKTFIKPLKLEN